MIETFILLLLAHVVGDFVLQSGWMVRDKHRPQVLAAHVGVILACSIVATGSLSPALFLLALAHAGIDAIKTGFRLNGLGWFLADQAAHVATLALAALIWPEIWANGLWMQVLAPGTAAWVPVVALHLAGILIATRAGGFVIGTLLAPYLDETPELTEGSLPAAGHMIGLLERGLTYVLVALGQPVGVAVLIAAKSVLRFSTVSGDRRVADYVIIGTMASIGWAVLTAVAVLALGAAVRP
ncbi:MAG: DUF3307 domain-containing protein [Mangrovicoccus sp.]|nr:DUF3307 domain-containing protein [Mangrovicoccus sp.]